MKKDENENGGFKQLISEFKAESKETGGAFKESFAETFKLARLANAWMCLKDGFEATMFEVNQDPVVPKSGKFKTLRKVNRQRIYFCRYMGRALRYGYLKFKWDIPARVDFDPTKVKSVLFLQHLNALGDMITETGLIKSMHKAGIAVDLIVPPAVKTILEGNPHVRNTYVIDPVTHPQYIYESHFHIPQEIIDQLVDNQYDLVIDTNTIVYPYHIFPLLNQIKPNAVIGFNRWPSVNYYAKSFDIDVRTTHVSQKGVIVANYLQIDSTEADKYDLYIPDEIDREAQQYLAGFNRPTLLVNIFASHKDRCFTMPQLSELLTGIQNKYPEFHIVLLDHKREITLALPDQVTINPFNTLHHCMALVKNVDYILSVDTAVVHMARAWRKPLLGIYRRGLTNNVLWAPGYEEAIQLIIKGEPLSMQPDMVEKVLEKVPSLLG